MENQKTSKSVVGATSVERYLEFSLGAEVYAMPLLAVREVIAVPEITPIPYTPPHFLGMMNLRGQVISVIDLRLKFNMKQAATHTPETAIIICNIGSLSLGVVVNSVNSVLALTSQDISEKPGIESSINTAYITGVTRKDNQLVLLLDIGKVLNVTDYAAITQAAPAKAA